MRGLMGVEFNLRRTGYSSPGSVIWFVVIAACSLWYLSNDAIHPLVDDSAEPVWR
jgi:hypothetical protein